MWVGQSGQMVPYPGMPSSVSPVMFGHYSTGACSRAHVIRNRKVSF